MKWSNFVIQSYSMLTKFKNFENNISIATTVNWDYCRRCCPIRDQGLIEIKKSSHLTIYYSIPHKIICKKLRNLFIKRYSKKSNINKYCRYSNHQIEWCQRVTARVTALIFFLHKFFEIFSKFTIPYLHNKIFSFKIF